MKKLLLMPALLLATLRPGMAQSFVKVPGPVPSTVCYADTEDKHTRLELPAAYLQQQRTGQRRSTAANIEVTYTGFTPQAQAAFQHAVDIWESLLVSPVTIHVQATWRPLGTGVLGSAGATAYYTDPSGGIRSGSSYPVALAEKIAGRDLNSPAQSDIDASFSSTFNWYYGLDGAVPAGKYDLVSVVLHELGHGLGCIASTGYSGGQGSYSTPASIYATYMENLAGQALTNNPQFANGSTALGTEYRSGNVYFNSNLAKAVNGGVRPRLYAPATYSAGSSISHLNEATYPAGNINSLMTPNIGAAEAMHNPGPLMLAMFNEMGWFNTAIRHTKLPDSETSQNFTVSATLVSDGTITPGSVKLNYSIDNGPLTTLVMTNTAGATYQAVIPAPGLNHTVSYTIQASDNETARIYTAPAATQPILNTTPRFSFVVGPDVTAPVIKHRPLTYLFASQLPYQFQTQATDNVAVNTVTVEYAVNGVARPALTLSYQAATNNFVGSLGTGGGPIVAGDVLTYRIVARDGAATVNQAQTPTYTVNIVDFKAAQNTYANNFNTTSAVDFVGEGFSIAQPTGFTNAAIHSDHQYYDDSTLVYQMLVPIRIAAQPQILSFDEIAIVEPGETGSVFGTEAFYDYVVVEGSKDNGATWTPVADGYDARLRTSWLAAWNSGTSGQNSTGVGTPAMFTAHTFNLGSKFASGDVVRLRFRLFGDPGAHGWGWAIDNLNVLQVTGTASELKAAGGLSVYPNPSAGQFRVRASFSKPTAGVELLVRNSLGQIVHRQAVTAAAGQLDLPVDLSKLAGGLYQVSLGQPGDAVTTKVLVQK
ncbi:T9SS type A sorting domain-containing protein [Hymenobacter persicinus]|uniref:T9SS type A sorting domain-containing protein n=1 Tax=Hymenobacter persicinus TaxID=2025506 RepID=A0A4Q5LC71_9BACT|nr:T9SS type A sorting domain-containing protein [Hymenobacter persicinus]RYU80287.1 T9SS type A sorting domain-containing protein [Hymenobacter persicinus]